MMLYSSYSFRLRRFVNAGPVKDSPMLLGIELARKPRQEWATTAGAVFLCVDLAHMTHLEDPLNRPINPSIHTINM